MGFGFFPSLFDHPKSISFEHQEKDEKIELFLRQHWVVNIPWIVGALIGFTFPILVFRLDIILNINILSNLPFEIALGGVLLWYMLLVAFILESFLSWYFNVYIVTNLHLVDINFHSLIAQDVTEVGLEEVQSQSAQRKGIWSALFDFGDVIIETAAQMQKISFHSVPNPYFVADRIQDLKEGGK